MNKKLIHVIGGTNAGKSTFLHQLANHSPALGVHLVEVGKILRAKYPPEKFKGQMAPDETEKEAWSLYCAGVREGFKNPLCSFILVDGQPRRMSQYSKVAAQAERCEAVGLETWFVLVHAPYEIREARALVRDPVGPARDLSTARLKTELPTILELVVHISRDFPHRFLIYDTTIETDAVRWLLSQKNLVN